MHNMTYMQYMLNMTYMQHMHYMTYTYMQYMTYYSYIAYMSYYAYIATSGSIPGFASFIPGFLSEDRRVVLVILSNN